MFDAIAIRWPARTCLLLMASTACAVAADDFEPPNKSARVQAVGSLAPVDKRVRAYFLENDTVSPLPKPGGSDWLNGPGKDDRGGQTFVQFMRSGRNKIKDTRRTLYLQPLGDIESENNELLPALEEFTSIFFQLPTKTLPPMDPAKLGIKRRMNPNTGKPQLLSTDILARLQQSVPNDAYSVIALTLTDLYPKESWNYVFGQASLRNRVGVFSLARYKPSFFRADNTPRDGDDALLTLRACKVLSHEMGHMFGMQHCVFYHCDMNGSNHLDETDAAPLHLCPVCLRKLQSAVDCNLTNRYRQLKTFYTKAGLKDQASYVGRRLRIVSATE